MHLFVYFLLDSLLVLNESSFSPKNKHRNVENNKNGEKKRKTKNNVIMSVYCLYFLLKKISFHILKIYFVKILCGNLPFHSAYVFRWKKKNL